MAEPRVEQRAAASLGVDVVLVRHGETEWSRSGRHTGRTDVPLTENGMSQAELLAARLEQRRFAAVFTSPLSRASETCRLAGLGETAQVRQELLEWDYGEYEGMTTEQIREGRPTWLLWRDGCPRGEDARQVGSRADTLLDELRRVDGDTAVFAHGHVLRVIAARWVGLPPEAGGMLALSTGTISVLGYEREVAVVRLWNDGSHLSQWV
jgi:broad specificity phosphatase PhoE